MGGTWLGLAVYGHHCVADFLPLLLLLLMPGSEESFRVSEPVCCPSIVSHTGCHLTSGSVLTCSDRCPVAGSYGGYGGYQARPPMYAGYQPPPPRDPYYREPYLPPRDAYPRPPRPYGARRSVAP